MIVISAPTSHKDLREFLATPEGFQGPVRIVEVTTTLRIVRILKGMALSEQVEFLYFDGREDVILAPHEAHRANLVV